MSRSHSSGRSRTTAISIRRIRRRSRSTDGTSGRKVEALSAISRRRRPMRKKRSASRGPTQPSVRSMRHVRPTPSSSALAISRRSRTRFPNRGVAAPRAGNALYLIDADTGTLIGNTSGSSCPLISAGSGSNKGCVTIGDVAGNGRKNTIQADPSAASDPGNYVVKKAYVGDSDGRYWRFNFDDRWHHFREPDGRHRRADLRIVCAAGRWQCRPVHVLCDGQRHSRRQARRAAPGRSVSTA